MERTVTPAAASLAELLAWGAARLAGSPTPRLDAQLLLGQVTGLGRAALLVHGQRPLEDPAQRARYRALVERRARGEPLAYLTGEREFWSFTVEVTPETLVPRPETELLVELALVLGPPGPARVADLGTGSGAVALALARERPAWQVVASDIAPATLAVARANARRLGLDAVAWLQGHWGAALAAAAFDLVVSNPPYVAEADPALAGALAFEPRRALASGPEGLDALRALAAGLPRCLRPGGWLLLEHGAGQGAAVREALAAAGLTDIETARDLAGLERVSRGRRAG